MEKIILFGTGKYYKTKIQSIMRQYEIELCIDNSVLRNESKKTEEGIMVINPADLDNKECRIFIMSVRFIPMWRQLITLGVEPERIVLPYDIKPYFENDEAISNEIQEVIFGSDSIKFVSIEGKETIIRIEQEWRAFLRDLYREKYPVIGAVSSMKAEPVSLQFGTERGTPIDREYIGRFLDGYRSFIRGDVLEIEDSSYTEQYGTDVSRSIVMDVSSNDQGVSFNANLETGEGIQDSIADCFILTQTLMYIYDLDSAVNNIHTLLKPGGVALITCSGISQNSRRCMDDYGCIFNFNVEALRKMFSDKDRFEIIGAGSYGNVKTVTAHIVGLCKEDIVDKDFDYNDKYYPLISYIAVRRVD